MNSSTNIDLLSTTPTPVNFDDVAIQLHADDNIAIAKKTLLAGTALIAHGRRLDIQQLIPSGHKFAMREISQGDIVRRYGQFIGFAKKAIGVGEQVHTHNLGMGAEQRDETTLHAVGQDYAYCADYKPITLKPENERRTFMGYKRPNGKVGTRNYIAVISSVNCSAHAVRKIAAHFTPEKLSAYANVDGVIAIAHGFGCATRVGGDDYVLLQRVLAGIAQHPNVGGYILVGLGCESSPVNELVANHELDKKAAPGVKRLRSTHQPAVPNMPITMTLQDNGGIRKTIQAGIAMIEQLLPMVNDNVRTPEPISELTVALQCGGSDGWSGVTANPALGLACDEIVRQGGSVNLAETPEVYGAEHLLTRRAARREVGEKLIERIHWWERHSKMHNVEINNNPSTGNKAGGLTTIYEKSLGAAAKAGNTPLNEVYLYAEQITERGFTFMDTPGYDPVAATGQVAGGCNLLVFTTGRGSCFGFKPTPSIKVASNTPMFERMQDDMDVNAGKILEGVPMQTVANDMLEMMIAVASGQKTKSEEQDVGAEEFQPWNLGGML